MLLSEYTSSKDNNFNLLRFIAAFAVLVTHSFSLTTGNVLDEPLRRTLGMSLGDIAVDLFFITSGFLITSSYLNRGNLIAFIWARVLRIYPGLIVAMIFSVFIIGLLFTNITISEYLLNTQTYNYFFKNIVLFFGVEYHLPGVFIDNPYPKAVNGSLWTLPFEVRMYTILAFIFTIVIFLRKRISIVIYKNILLFVGMFSLLILFINHFYPLRETSTLVPKFIRLFSAFFIGAMFYMWRDYIMLKRKWFYGMLVLIVISSIQNDIYFIFYALILPYIIFYLAYVPKGFIRKFNSFGDYSYGMYIYAFPIQQSLVSFYSEISIVNMIIFSFVITLILSILSWNFVEKKFLRMKNIYS